MKEALLATRIAIYAGGAFARGISTAEGMREDIRSKMAEYEVEDQYFQDIEDLAFQFANFSQDVRAAERKGQPLTKSVGEKF